VWRLAVLDTGTLQLDTIDLPYTEISSVHAEPGCVLFNGASASEPSALIMLDLATRQTTVLRRSYENRIDASYFATRRRSSFPPSMA